MTTILVKTPCGPGEYKATGELWSGRLEISERLIVETSLSPFSWVY